MAPGVYHSGHGLVTPSAGTGNSLLRPTFGGIQVAGHLDKNRGMKTKHASVLRKLATNGPLTAHEWRCVCCAIEAVFEEEGWELPPLVPARALLHHPGESQTETRP